VSELPCVSCGVDIPAEASNCPHCGQRQLTRATAVGYVTVGLPAVLLSVGGGLVVWAPSLLDATVGRTGLAAGLLVAYAVGTLGFAYAYLRRRRLLRQRRPRTTEEDDRVDDADPEGASSPAPPSPGDGPSTH
jgi:hypothetical protein